MPIQKPQLDPVAKFHQVRTEILFECRGDVKAATEKLLSTHRAIHAAFLAAIKVKAYRTR